MMGMTPPAFAASGRGLGVPAPGRGSGAVAPPNVPVQAPQARNLGQGGVARSPTPQPVAVTPPSGMTASPQTTGFMQQAVAVYSVPPTERCSAPPAKHRPANRQRRAARYCTGTERRRAPGRVSTGSTGSTETAQLSPQVQQQQNQPRQGPDLSHFDGQFDFNTLMHNLTRIRRA